MRELGIGAADGSIKADYNAVLSLVFAEGRRPDVAAVQSLANGEAAGAGAIRFAVSHAPDPAEGWIEILSCGLTFDCAGLAPAQPVPTPDGGALLGLEKQPLGEAISLSPGPHLADAMGMLPVVRVLAGLGAQLAALPGAAAVIWNPARCWMPPAYFGKVVGNWLANGPFPALGLTSLERESDGAIVSVGLALLTGQELRFLPDPKLVPADIARIAVRLIHALIETEPLTGPHTFVGPDRETLLVTPNLRGTQLDVTIER
ncbi:MAG: hypothetical protein QFC78_01135 [Pseudomonadota bacterium]|nr:hypothetical protein [Pseudomonadota bacterium]